MSIGGSFDHRNNQPDDKLGAPSFHPLPLNSSTAIAKVCHRLYPQVAGTIKMEHNHNGFKQFILSKFIKHLSGSLISALVKSDNHHQGMNYPTRVKSSKIHLPMQNTATKQSTDSALVFYMQALWHKIKIR